MTPADKLRAARDLISDPEQDIMNQNTTSSLSDQTDSLNELASALAKAQGQIKSALKDSTNPHFKSKYADLTAVWEACREPLSQNGLSIIQRGTGVNGVFVMRTRLLHSSGQWIEGDVPCITGTNNKNEMQALGSAITYARRYGLMSMVGIAPDDDDGNATADQHTSQPAQEPVIGALTKTQLQKKMREFDSELRDCTDLSMLDGLLVGYRKEISQCRDDMPSWWYGGDDMPSDFVPMEDRVNNKRMDLEDIEMVNRQIEDEQTVLDAG
ncbi:MAG: ERF family protein [Gammaproteobacteria bacterium]